MGVTLMIMEFCAAFTIPGRRGDIIYSLATVRAYCLMAGGPARLVAAGVRAAAWREVLAGAGLPILLLGSRGDSAVARSFHGGLGLELLPFQAADGLAPARALGRAAAFRGGQSAGAALSEALGKPGLQDAIFHNAPDRDSSPRRWSA